MKPSCKGEDMCACTGACLVDRHRALEDMPQMNIHSDPGVVRQEATERALVQMGKLAAEQHRTQQVSRMAARLTAARARGRPGRGR